MHRKLLNKIVEKGTKADMECLADLMITSMDHLKECDKELYEKLEMKMYEMAYGKVLTEDMARNIIMNMRPYGMKWTLEQTREVQRQMNMTSLNEIDFWVVMNSAYNDYNDIFDDNIDQYAKFSKDFINDEDAKEGKVFTYFIKIPK